MPVDELSFRPVALSTNCHLRFFFFFEEKRRSAEMEMRIFFLGQFLFFIFISVVALMSFSHFFSQTQFLSTASNAKPQFFGLFILLCDSLQQWTLWPFSFLVFWGQSYEHFFCFNLFCKALRAMVGYSVTLVAQFTLMMSHKPAIFEKKKIVLMIREVLA